MRRAWPVNEVRQVHVRADGESIARVFSPDLLRPTISAARKVAAKLQAQMGDDWGVYRVYLSDAAHTGGGKVRFAAATNGYFRHATPIPVDH